MGNDAAHRLRTSALFRGLFKASDIKEFVEQNAEEMRLPSFGEYITELSQKRLEAPERIIKRANIERSFGHQLFKGTRRPSRDTVLQLAFGFEADPDGARNILRIAGMSALYPRIRRDVAILYCLHHHLPLVEAQKVLQEMNLPLIGGRKHCE